MKQFIKPALWIIGFQAISALIGMVTRSGMPWYQTLEKSSLTPPDLAFPIVWTILYVMLALAAYRVWEYARTHGKNTPVFLLFWAQMLMNWGWSFIFFGLQMAQAGFIWICVLNILMAGFIAISWKPLKSAAIFVFPTLLWGCFAAYLNYMIWALN